MVSISLCDHSGMRSDFGCFQVEACRNEDGVKILRLVGLHVDLDMCLTIKAFDVDSFDEVLDLCDMLNDLLEFKIVKTEESKAIGVVASLYPGVFKYLAEFGYESPSQEGGAADA